MMLRVQLPCQQPHRREDVENSVSSAVRKESDTTAQKPSPFAIVLTDNEDDEDAEMSKDNDEEVNQDKENGDSEDDCPDGVSMTDSCNIESTCSEETTQKTAVEKSFSSEIKMNEVDEAEGLDRLLFDLSNDEVSMFIDLFGKGCDIGKTTNKPASSLLPDLHSASKNAKGGHNSIPVSKQDILQENQKNNATKKDVTGVGNKQHYQPLPRSLFQHYNPAIQHLRLNAMSFNTMNMTPYGPYEMYNFVSNPRPGYVSPPFALPVAQQEAAKNSVLKETDSTMKVEVSSKQMTEEGDPKAPSKESLPPVPVPKSPSEVLLQPAEKNEDPGIGNGPTNKAPPAPAPTPCDVLPTAAKDDKASPTNKATATSKKAKKRTKVAPARKKRTNARKSKPRKGTSRKRATPQQGDTYITFPKNRVEDRWSDHFKGAQEFRKQHGHCRIPTTYEPNPGLANWAKRQRYHIKNFKKHFLDRPDNPAVVTTKASPNRCFPLKRPGMRVIKCLMTMERLELLESINFCSSLHDTSWDRMYARLCYFSKRNGGCMTPKKCTDTELWRWCGTQRYQMNMNKKWEQEEKEPTGAIDPSKCYPGLTQERIERLNKINFVWDDKSAACRRQDK